MRNRGVALVLTLFAVVIVATIAFAGVSLVTVNSRAAETEEAAARAYYLARAGISRALAELKVSPAYTGSTMNNFGGGSATVTCTRQTSQSLTGATDTWVIDSVGRFGANVRTIRAWAQFETFARYSYFTNREISSFSNGTIFFIGQDRLDGPVHTNGHFSISGQPQFTDKVTSANVDEIPSVFNPHAMTYSLNNQTFTDTKKFYHPQTNNYQTHQPVAQPGFASQFSFNGGQPEIPMPTDPGLISTTAAGPTHRIYDSKAINGSSTTTRDIRLRFYVQNGVSRLEVRRHNGSLLEDIPVTPTMTVFVKSGNARVEGTVKGLVTVGVGQDNAAPGSTGDIIIPKNLKYNDKSKDMMGLIAHNDVRVIADGQPRELNASMMAINGSFTVDSFQSIAPQGNLTVLGGIIQNKRGPVATFRGTSIVSGYAKNYQFDRRMLLQPPPMFLPTGRLLLRGMRDLGALQ